MNLPIGEVKSPVLTKRLQLEFLKAELLQVYFRRSYEEALLESTDVNIQMSRLIDEINHKLEELKNLRTNELTNRSD